MIILEDDPKRTFTTVAVSPDGKLVAAGGGATNPVVWELATGREVHRLDFATEPVGEYVDRTITRQLAFHPTRPLMHVHTEAGVFDYSLDTEEHRPVLPKRAYFTECACFDPAGRGMIIAHYRDHDAGHLCGHFLNCARLLSSGKYRRTWQRNQTDPPNDGFLKCLTFFPDGERFAAVEVSAPYFQFDGPALAIRSVETGDLIQRVTGAHTECDEMAVSPGGEWLVTRTRTALQAFTTGDFTAAPRTIAKSGKKRFTGLAFHPSGDYLAVSNTDATIHFYDTSTWEVTRTFTWDIGRMRSIAFSPDGTLAAAGSDNGKVVVWDVDV